LSFYLSFQNLPEYQLIIYVFLIGWIFLKLHPSLILKREKLFGLARVRGKCRLFLSSGPSLVPPTWTRESLNVATCTFSSWSAYTKNTIRDSRFWILSAKCEQQNLNVVSLLNCTEDDYCGVTKNLTSDKCWCCFI